MTDWYSDPQYKQTIITPLTENQAAVYLKEAFAKIVGTAPKTKSVAILWAQCALETGRFHKINNFNYGNIKKVHAPNDDGHDFTMFATGENLWDKTQNKSVWTWFTPPHTQTHFISNKNGQEGAEHYVAFLAKRTRYAKAWAQAIVGDPTAYNHELKNAGYYTADEAIYGKTLFSLTNYFMQHATELLKDLTPETANAQATQSTELLSQQEKDQILSLVSLTNHMSLEEYFKNSNNNMCSEQEQNEQA